MDTIKDRIDQLIENKGLSIRSFERQIGVSNGYFKGVKNSIGSDKVENILQAFPDLNPTWLLTGEGSMLNSEEEEEGKDPSPKTLAPENAVTFHPGLTAQAGYVDTPWGDNDSTELFYIDGYEGCHAIRAVGDSMYPTITNGDIVIHELSTERYIRNGEVYIVVDEVGAIMIKRVMQDVSGDGDITFTFFSDNPNQSKYKPFTIPGEQIRRLYRVRAVIKQLT